MDTVSIAPLEPPDLTKASDSFLTNAITRIAGIKGKETQIDPAKPFVLWIDLQDPTVWGTSIDDSQLVPVYSLPDGHVGSGALWYALHGRKNELMLEMRGFVGTTD